MIAEKVIALGECQKTLDIISSINERIRPEEVCKVLIHYKESKFAIGDSCIRLNSLRSIKTFFHNASIVINFSRKEHIHIYEALLRNDPAVGHVCALDWEEIEFDKYDLVFFGSDNEVEFLSFLHRTYGEMLENGVMKLAVFSFSELIWYEEDNLQCVFSFSRFFQQFDEAHRPDGAPNKIYITQEEKEWADRWLEAKGVKKHERLFVLLDSTSRRDKMMSIMAYFDLLSYLLTFQDVKILIFDEKDTGKEQFYAEWLGEKCMSKMIFSKKMEFRKDLTLLGSTYVKMIFGPCTGLMHCASAIYNCYMSQGMKRADMPLMVVYTGVYKPVEKCAAFWWGNSPLVDCLMLKRRGNGKKLVLLESLNQGEKMVNDSLPCAEFTPEMLKAFIGERFQTKLC